MKILAIEPYYTGSHKAWIDQLIKRSSHQFKLLSLPGRHWKWRMHGGALSLFDQLSDFSPDLILFTDMMDVALFLSLTRKKFAKIPCVLYFHENQFAYPKSPLDEDCLAQRDDHYGFINFTSALSVDRIFFNSKFNRESFLRGSKKLIKSMPDYNKGKWIAELEQKSQVLRLGVDLSFMHPVSKKNSPKVILWNHRWEYDKNPQLFFKMLKKLKENNVPFQLNLIGPRNQKYPPLFDQGLKEFSSEIIRSDEVHSREDYIRILKESDIIPVTSNQEFFGISAAEAISCGVIPLLPNKLAYPEIIPDFLYPDFLYSHELELYKKLKFFLTTEDPVKSEKRDSLWNHCRQYHWDSLGPKYDQLFQEVVENRSFQ